MFISQFTPRGRRNTARGRRFAGFATGHKPAVGESRRGGENFPKPWRLAAPVGPGGDNWIVDVSKVRNLLAVAGRLDPSTTACFADDREAPLVLAVMDFQRAAGLEVDGYLVPGGPTIEALTCPPGEFPGFTATARELPAALDRLPSGIVADNVRAIGMMMRTGYPGRLPARMAEAWGGTIEDKAAVVDLIDRLRLRSRAAADALRERLAPLIPARDRGLLHVTAGLRRLAAIHASALDAGPHPREQALARNIRHIRRMKAQLQRVENALDWWGGRVRHASGKNGASGQLGIARQVFDLQKKQESIAKRIDILSGENRVLVEEATQP